MNGVVTFNEVPVIKDGTSYTITEVTAPPGYLPTTTQLTAKVEYNGAKTAVVVTNPITDLKNDPAPFVANTKISVLKTDEDGAKLAGAYFTLYNSSGDAIAVTVSGNDGNALFTNLPINKSYTIKETSAPNGYELSTQILSFTLIDESPLTFTVINKKLPGETGTISILKTDESGRPLSGAEFTLYDKDGKPLQTVFTQLNGTAKFEKVPVGAYTVSETRAPLGYTALTDPTSVTIKNEQDVSLTFINKKDVTATGKLQLLKVDKDYQPLSGAEFTLYDKQGNVLAKAVSATNGIALFEGIAPGSYSVKETVAPSGYKLFSESLTVQFSASGASLSYTLKNTLLTDNDSGVEGWNDNNNGGTLPKTGGTPWSFYLFLLGLVSLLAGIVFMRPDKKYGKHITKN